MITDTLLILNNKRNKENMHVIIILLQKVFNVKLMCTSLTSPSVSVCCGFKKALEHVLFDLISINLEFGFSQLAIQIKLNTYANGVFFLKRIC